VPIRLAKTYSPRRCLIERPRVIELSN
jgi:hypothetical protein